MTHTKEPRNIGANCPFCSPGTSWGMSPEGWAEIRRDHYEGHPKAPPVEPKSQELHMTGKYPASTGKMDVKFVGENKVNELDELFEVAVSSWERQGRSAEEKYAIRNFMTGKGLLLKNDIKAIISAQLDRALEALPKEKDFTKPENHDSSCECLFIEDDEGAPCTCTLGGFNRGVSECRDALNKLKGKL